MSPSITGTDHSPAGNLSSSVLEPDGSFPAWTFGRGL